MFKKLNKGVEHDRLLDILHKFTRGVIEEKLKEGSAKMVHRR